MEVFGEDYNEYFNIGDKFYQSGKINKSYDELEYAIQYFQKSIVAADISSVKGGFPSAVFAIEMAKKEISNLKNNIIQ